MAYFAREDASRHKSPPRKHGLAVGARPVPEQHVISREQLLDQAISQMAPKDSSDSKALGPMRFINDTERDNRPSRNVHKKPDSDIFGPPVIPPAPKPRVRVGVTEEELSKIWKEDEAKFQAALAMERGRNMVDKMVAEPVNPVMVSARSKDAVPPPRRVIELLSETQQERNLANAPAGFGGMGAHSNAERRQGRHCKPVEEFVPQELVQKPRGGGRRTKFPADTLSFQDDYQTY